MNIDWSKAPEGATHYAIGDWVYKWFKKVDENTLDFWLGESWLRGVQTPAQTFAFYGEGNIVARPGAWNGEGLPPAGLLVENNLHGPVMVLAHGIHRGGDVVLCQGHDTIITCTPDTLSPIRTAEQIAAEERAAEVAEMINLSVEGHQAVTIAQARILCTQLHKAGYRKQVQP